jgi:hypothetical protein
MDWSPDSLIVQITWIFYNGLYMNGFNRFLCNDRIIPFDRLSKFEKDEGVDGDGIITGRNHDFEF